MGNGGHAVALGITDLMTSLAVMFALLFVVFANAPHPPEGSREQTNPEVEATPAVDRVRSALEEVSPPDVAVRPDVHDAHVMRVIIPESALHFDLGRSTLSQAADRFLTDVMPAYAGMLCGTLRPQVESVVVEGHTDDLGSDVDNLRLSQERSFRVLVRGLDAIRVSAPEAYGCFSELVSASGRGEQDLVYDAERRPDRELSRRVVLKILLRSV